MRKNIIFIFLMIISVFFVAGCKNTKTIKTSTNKSEKTSSLTVSKTESKKTTTTITTAEKGAEENPMTAGEAVGYVLGELNSMQFSSKEFYVTGVVSSTPEFNSKYNSYAFDIKTNATSSSLLNVYSATLSGDAKAPHVGDEVLVKGYLYHYVKDSNDTPEMTGDSELNVSFPVIISSTHSERQITLGAHEHATVGEFPSSAICGSTISLVITADEGYEISKVSVSGKRIALKDNKYTFEVLGDSVINVETVVEGTAPLGSLNNPYPANEMVDIILSELASKEWSAEKVYAIGKVVELEYNSQYKEYKAKLVTVGDESKELTVYGGKLSDQVTSIHMGDIVTAYGFYQNFNGTPEITGDSKTNHDYPIYAKIEHTDKTITLGAHEHATVTGLPETAKCGSKVEFSIEVEEGYKVQVAKAGDIRCNYASGKYSFTVSSNAEITVTCIEEGNEVYIGSLEEPLSVAEAIEEIKPLGDNNYTDSRAFVTGIVDSATFNSTHESYTMYIHDVNNPAITIQVYSGTLEVGATEPHIGDTVVALGYMVHYVSEGGYTKAYEITGSTDNNLDYPVLKTVTHKERTITVEVANATINGIPEKAQCGENVEFTVTPNEGYRVYKVSVNGTVIEKTNDKYSFNVTGDTKVVAKILGASESDPVPVTKEIKIADVADNNNWKDATQYTSFTIDSIITFSCNGQPSKNTGKYYQNGENWRLYSTEGGAITITIDDRYEFTGFSYTRSGKDDGGLKGYDQNVEYKIAGNSITIETGAKCFIASFKISYIEK